MNRDEEIPEMQPSAADHVDDAAIDQIGAPSLPSDIDLRAVFRWHRSDDFAALDDRLVEELVGARDVYTFGGELVHVVGLPGERRALPLDPHALRDRLSGLLRVEVRQKIGDMWVWASKSIALDRTREVLARRAWPGVRPLRRVVHDPTVRADGSLVATDGYDEATGLLVDLAPEWRDWRPARPVTQGEAYRLARQLGDEIVDFGLDGPGVAAWLSCVLSMVGRHLIDGPAPLFVFDAPVRGSGKSLLARLAMRIGGVRGECPAGSLAPADRDDERAKAILAVLRDLAPVAYLFDNATGQIGSASLDRLLTSSSYADRVLGVSRIAVVPNLTTWLLTANNANLSAADTIRRVMLIRLDPGTGRPEKRSGFRHARIEQWVADNRRDLHARALAILRGYLVAGRPAQKLDAFGSFEAWSDVAASAVAWAGMGDPIAVRRSLDERDEQGIAFAAVLEILATRYPPGATFRARQVAELATPGRKEGKPVPPALPGLADALGVLLPAGASVEARSVGALLGDLRGRQDGDGRRLQSRSDRKGVQEWRVTTDPAADWPTRGS